MRREVGRDVLQEFFKEFSKPFKSACSVYILGGASALIYGWRASTHDIDLKVLPDNEAFNIIAKLKDRLSINIELASPDDFIPALPSWQERSIFIERYGKVDFLHYDFYSQALSKIERGFERDLLDVRSMYDSGLLDLEKLQQLFTQIEPDLIRYPAIDPKSFKLGFAKFIATLEADSSD